MEDDMVITPQYIALTVTILSFALGLGAWIVKQLKDVKTDIRKEVETLHTRISKMKSDIDENKDRINDTHVALATIQESLKGLTAQVSSFVENTGHTLEILNKHSQELGSVKARCEERHKQPT